MGRESREGRRPGGEAGGGEVSVSAVGEGEGENGGEAARWGEVSVSAVGEGEGRRTGGEAGGGEVSVSAVGEAEGEKSRGDQVRRRCKCVLDVSVGRREEGDGETGEERHVCVRCKVAKEGGGGGWRPVGRLRKRTSACRRWGRVEWRLVGKLEGEERPSVCWVMGRRSYVLGKGQGES